MSRRTAAGWESDFGGVHTFAGCRHGFSRQRAFTLGFLGSPSKQSGQNAQPRTRANRNEPGRKNSIKSCLTVPWADTDWREFARNTPTGSAAAKTPSAKGKGLRLLTTDHRQWDHTTGKRFRVAMGR